MGVSAWAAGYGGVPGARLSAVANPRWNSLNALRLFFAGAVIVSHAWPIGGYGQDPEIAGVGLGGWAVAGFFSISGYLISSSRLNTPLLPFLWRRFLRIFPGLWMCLLVIVFVFVPIAVATNGGGDGAATGVARFVGANAVLLHVEGIGGTLADVPYPNTWNGSLWTLFYEVACYVIVASIFTLGFVQRRPARSLWVLFLGFVLVTTAVQEFDVGVPYRAIQLAYLGSFFWAGALLFVHARQIPAGRATAAGTFAVLVVICLAGHVEELSALPFAFLVLWLGFKLPLQRLGRRNDISYGVYIYAFPVQQLLVLAGAHHLGAGAYVALCVAASLPLAAASWFVVEKPALALKRVVEPRRVPAADFEPEPVLTAATDPAR
jgi:peptidoglycan/LPS O-acetylase OafA/YrhL